MSSLLDYCNDFEKQSFSPNQEIIVQGENSKTVYVLIKGELDICVNEKLISSLSAPGTVIGEISALLDVKRTTTVRATEACEFYLIPDVFKLFETDIEASLELTKAEFCRLILLTELLLHLKESFLQTAEHVGLDLTQIPVFNDYMKQWKDSQEETAAKYPFILETDLEEAVELNLKPGDIVFNEGECIDKFYALKQGVVTYTRKDQAFSFDISTPGTVLNVGHSLVPFDTILTATVKEPTVLMQVDNVSNLFTNHYSAGFELLRQVAQRIVLLTGTFAEMKEKFFHIDKNIDPELRDKMQQLVDFLIEKEKSIQEAIFRNS